LAKENYKGGAMKIHLKNNEVKKLYEENGGVKTSGSVGFDLVAAKDYQIKKGDFGIIDLGLVIKPQDGFYTEIVPRSSTFKKYGLLQANSVGIIDADYCGSDDFIGFAYYATKDIEIKAGTAIAQAIKRVKIPFEISFFMPEENSRGGFGSTDKKET
jgi:dUTP pyrophosphatase